MTERCCKKYWLVWREDKEAKLGGYTKCLSCGAHIDDYTGVPRGCIVLNGKVWSYSDAQKFLVCPICRSKLISPFRDGETKLLCANKETPHDVGAMHKAMTAKSAAWKDAEEEYEAEEVYERMPQEYRDLL